MLGNPVFLLNRWIIVSIKRFDLCRTCVENIWDDYLRTFVYPKRRKVCALDHHQFCMRLKRSCRVTYLSWNGCFTRLVIVKASSLLREFWERVTIAQYCSVRLFFKQHGMAHQMEKQCRMHGVAGKITLMKRFCPPEAFGL